MESSYFKNISNFFVAGINYKKSDASIRGQYAISNDQYRRVLENASLRGLNEIFVLSTCNRTEIYGFAYNADQLIDLICSETSGPKEIFIKAAYIKNGADAINHLFMVGAGLDSQLLGDYEIVGQLKNAIRYAKEKGFVRTFTDRLINHVLQASKTVKNNTQLSGGTVSVSFAAVQFIRNLYSKPFSGTILLLGAGKLGQRTCRNLIDYLETKNITVINRSPEKANGFAQELGIKWQEMQQLSSEIEKADIIMVATNSAEPTILTSHLKGKGKKLIIDLSIPYNVEQSAKELKNIRLINVDELSKLKDETLKTRLAEVPKAKTIISSISEEFYNWCEMRKHAPMLKQLKGKLKEIYTHPQYLHKPVNSCAKTIDGKIQKVVNETAGKMRVINQRGCQYIAAINDFISAN